MRILGASSLVLFLVWQRIQATRLGYEVERSRREANVLKGRIASLRVDLETSLSPARLAWVARARLGMSPAAPDSLRFLDRPFAPAGDRTLLGWLPRSWRSLLRT